MIEPESSAGDRGHHLEDRSRHVASLGGAVQQRRGLVGAQAVEIGAGRRRIDQLVGVVGGVADERQDAAGLGLDRDDGAPVVAERLERRLLEADVDREVQLAGVVRVAPELAQQLVSRAELLQPGELPVVGVLEAARPEQQALVADDRRHGRVRIAAQGLSARLLDAHRHHLAAAVDDAAARRVPLGGQDQRVAGVVGERSGLDHLPPAHAEHQAGVHDHQRQADTQQRRADARCACPRRDAAARRHSASIPDSSRSGPDAPATAAASRAERLRTGGGTTRPRPRSLSASSSPITIAFESIDEPP